MKTDIFSFVGLEYCRRIKKEYYNNRLKLLKRYFNLESSLINKNSNVF